MLTRLFRKYIFWYPSRNPYFGKSRPSGCGLQQHLRATGKQWQLHQPHAVVCDALHLLKATLQASPENCSCMSVAGAWCGTGTMHRRHSCACNALHAPPYTGDTLHLQHFVNSPLLHRLSPRECPDVATGCVKTARDCLMKKVAAASGCPLGLWCPLGLRSPCAPACVPESMPDISQFPSTWTRLWCGELHNRLLARQRRGTVGYEQLLGACDAGLVSAESRRPSYQNPVPCTVFCRYETRLFNAPKMPQRALLFQIGASISRYGTLFMTSAHVSFTVFLYIC